MACNGASTLAFPRVLPLGGGFEPLGHGVPVLINQLSRDERLADRKWAEALRGDPERQKQLLELQAVRLELEARITELVSKSSGGENGSK